MKKFLSLLALLCVTTAFSQTEVHTLKPKQEVPKPQLSDFPELLWAGAIGVVVGVVVLVWGSKERF